MSPENKITGTGQQSKGKLCAINSRMIPSKLAYLLSLGCSGSYVPYLNIFFRSIGLTNTQAGFISGIRFLTVPISTPFWGSLTDSSGYRKLIFLILCLGYTLPIFCMPWVAREINNVSYNLSASAAYEDSANDTHTPEVTVTTSQDSTLFYVILSTMTIAGFFSVPLAGFIDSIVMNVIKTGKQKTCFGAQRLFGSISFGLANFLAGVAVDNYNHPTLSKYTAIFYIFLPQMLLLMPIGYVLLGQAKWEEKKRENKKCYPISKHLSSFFCKIDSIFFMITVFISGIAYNMFYGFLFLLMRDEMNACEKLMTLVIVTTSLAEIVTFPFTSKLIRFLGGTNTTIMLGIFSYFLRFLSMSYAKEAWVLIPIQLLHGIGFSLSWTAQVEHTHKITPKSISVTVFSILVSVHFAVGAVVANVLGGELYDFLGGRMLFRVTGIICGVWAFFMLLYQLLKHFRASRTYDFTESVKHSREKNQIKILHFSLNRNHDNDLIADEV